MTNCPNCGAPYKLHSRVCEYCGSVREDTSERVKCDNADERSAAFGLGDTVLIDIGGSIDDVPGILQPYIFNHTMGAYIRDPSQQAACGVQNISNALSGMTCSIQQARLNAEQSRLNYNALHFQSAQQAQYNSIVSAVNQAELKKPAAPKRFRAYMAWMMVQTFLFPSSVRLCYALVQKPSIVARFLGAVLLPLYIFTSYIIIWRSLKR